MKCLSRLESMMEAPAQDTPVPPTDPSATRGGTEGNESVTRDHGINLATGDKRGRGRHLTWPVDNF